MGKAILSQPGCVSRLLSLLLDQRYSLLSRACVRASVCVCACLHACMCALVVTCIHIHVLSINRSIIYF